MSRPLRASLLAAVALAVVLTVFVAGPTPDPRHVALASSSPAGGATLAQAPTEIELAFTAALDPELSHVSVRDKSGTAVNVGRPRLVMPQRLRQPVNITDAGEVTVAYHVTAVDGTESIGSLRFSAASGSAAGPGATTGRSAANADSNTNSNNGLAEPTHQHGIDPISAALLALDGIVALAVVVLLMLRPPRRAPSHRAVSRAWRL